MTARIASAGLTAASRDLLYNDENIKIDKSIQLKAPTTKFSSALYAIIDANRTHFSEFMAWPRFVTHENDTASFLDACALAHQNNESKTYIVFLNDALIGMLSFNSIDKENKTAYIGYWLDSKAQGKGVMRRAIAGLIKHYTDQGMIKRFVIKCSVNNLKSNAVAQHCGFIHEGRLRQAECLNGVFYDQNIYSWIAPNG